MNTKLALSLLVAVCAVTAIIASFAVSRPAMTQSDTPQPTSTPVPPQTPPATLEPLTPDEFHELVGSVCNAVEVRSLRADLDGDTLELDWRTSHYSGPHLGPRYHGYEIGYRIERRREASNDAEANWGPGGGSNLQISVERAGGTGTLAVSSGRVGHHQGRANPAVRRDTGLARNRRQCSDGGGTSASGSPTPGPAGRGDALRQGQPDRQCRGGSAAGGHGPN